MSEHINPTRFVLLRNLGTRRRSIFARRRTRALRRSIKRDFLVEHARVLWIFLDLVRSADFGIKHLLLRLGPVDVVFGVAEGGRNLISVVGFGFWNKHADRMSEGRYNF